MLIAGLAPLEKGVNFVWVGVQSNIHRTCGIFPMHPTTCHKKTVQQVEEYFHMYWMVTYKNFKNFP